MSCLRFAAIVSLLSIAAAAADEPSLGDARKLETALQSAIAHGEPAVVCLLVRREREVRQDPSRKANDLDDRNTPPDYFGSGVVIDDQQGLILTHYHVVRRAGRILVRAPARKGDDGPREANATIYAADSRCDLAVLKVNGMGGSLTAIKMGNGERLRKGSFVVALGYPYASGFRDGSASASWGVISNLRRRPPGVTVEIERARLLTNLGVLLQTDARLQLGSSGGALIDLDGRLVGLTTAQAALTGVDAPGGYAIPIDANYRRIVEVLARGEEVEYGFLGVTTQANPNPLIDRPRDGGFYVDGVTPNSPAERAGLRRGDAILAVNGQPVREYDDLFFYLAAAMAGRRTELQIQRMGELRPRSIDVVLAKYPVDTDRDASRATNLPRSVYGLRVDYTSVVAKVGEPLPDGVIVRSVQPNSPAKAANLVEFVDMITDVNDKPINSPAEFYREVDKAAKSGDKLKLGLRNPPRTVTLP
jgi:serine protease Do